jgi:hypothetical protein
LCTVCKYIPLNCYGHLYAVRKCKNSAACICEPLSFLVPSTTTDLCL